MANVFKRIALLLCCSSLLAACEGPDPTPAFEVVNKTVLETTEAGGTDSFTLALASEPKANVSITLRSSNPAEGMLLDSEQGPLPLQTVVFTPNNWKSPQTITVVGIDDTLQDGDVSYIIYADKIQTSDLDYSALSFDNIAALNLDDDGPGGINKAANILINPQAVQTSEGDTAPSASFTVALTRAPASGKEVHILVASDNTNEAQVDVSELTFSADDWSEKTVAVTGVDDNVVDGNQTYHITLNVDANPPSGHLPADEDFVGLTITPVNGTNVDNEQAVAAAIVFDPSTGLQTSENGDSVDIAVKLSSPPSAAVSLNFVSSDTSEGLVAPSQLTFDAGNFTIAQHITITGVNDPDIDGDQSYTVDATISSSDANYASLGLQTLSLVNLDNDPEPTAGVTVQVTSASSTENGGAAQFTMVLDSVPGADVTVALTSSNPGEGQPANGSLTFTAANWQQAQTVDITGQDDSVADGDQSYDISFSVSSTDNNYNGYSIPAVALTNIDNEVASLVVTPAGGVSTSESGTSADIMVKLNAKPIAGDTVTVSATVADPSEGSLSPASQSFNDTDWDIPKTFTVTGVADNIVDADITYNVNFSVAAAATNPYNAISTTPYPVTNTNVDVSATPQIVFTAPASLVTTESGGTVSFDVSLATAPGGTVTIAASSDTATEATVTSADLIFDDSNFGTVQQIVVTGQDDSVVDGDIAYQVSFTVSAANTNYAGLTLGSQSLSNSDDETPGLTITPSTGLQTSEPNGKATFDLSLSAQPAVGTTVSITLSSSDSTEGVVDAPATLSFNNGDWNTPQTVSITGQDDTLLDGNVQYQIDFAISATPTTNPYNALTQAPLSIVNLDNETPQVNITASGNQTNEAGAVAAVSIDISLSQQPPAGSTVTISASSSNTAEATVNTPGSVSFTDTDWSTPKSIGVTGQNDDIADGDVAYSINFSVTADTTGNPYDGLSVPALNFSNVDNDFIQVGLLPGQGSDSSGGMVTLLVSLLQTPPGNIDISAASGDTTIAKTYPRDASDLPMPLSFTPSSDPKVAQVIRSVGQAGAPGSGSYAVNFTISSNTAANFPVQVPQALSLNDVAPGSITPGVGDAVYDRFIEPGNVGAAAFTIMTNIGTTVQADGIETFTDAVGLASTVSGPPLQANQGQVLHFNLFNDHLDAHSLLIHRLLQDSLTSGEFGAYHITAPEAGTYLIGSTVAEEQYMGLASVLEVQSPQANTAWDSGPAFDQEKTWLIMDMDETWINLKVNAGDPNRVRNAAYTPTVQLVNGRNSTARTDANDTRLISQVHAAGSPTAADVILVRILNAGSVTNTITFPDPGGAGNSGVKVISQNGVHAADVAALPYVTQVSIGSNQTMMLLYDTSLVAPNTGTYDIAINNSIVSEYASNLISILEFIP